MFTERTETQLPDGREFSFWQPAYEGQKTFTSTEALLRQAMIIPVQRKHRGKRFPRRHQH